MKPKTENTLSESSQKKLFMAVKMYCMENGTNQRELCKKMDYRQSPFSQIIHGSQNPGYEFWRKLEKATNGKIKRGDYYDE